MQLKSWIGMLFLGMSMVLVSHAVAQLDANPGSPKLSEVEQTRPEPIHSSRRNYSGSDVELFVRGWGSVNKPVEIKGRKAWQSEKWQDTKDRHFYFDIQNPLLKNGNPESVKITLTYLDQFEAPVSLQYIDRAETFKSVKPFQAAGSGISKTHNWEISDALFKSTCGSHDFRVTFGVDKDVVIEGCSILAEPKFTTVCPFLRGR